MGYDGEALAFGFLRIGERVEGVWKMAFGRGIPEFS